MVPAKRHIISTPSTLERMFSGVASGLCNMREHGAGKPLDLIGTRSKLKLQSYHDAMRCACNRGAGLQRKFLEFLPGEEDHFTVLQQTHSVICA